MATLFTDARKAEMYQFASVAFNAIPGQFYFDQLRQAVEAGLTTRQIVNIFTEKEEYLSVYPNSLSNLEFAQALVRNVIRESANQTTKDLALAQLMEALNANLTRGDVIFNVFSNLARREVDPTKPGFDPTDVFNGVAGQFKKQLEVAKYYTETLKLGGADLAPLQAINSRVNLTSVTTTDADKQALILGTKLVAPTQATNLGTLNDPLLGSQWYLKNTGQRYAEGDVRPNTLLDINVEQAWASGYTGKGIRIAVNDDGIDLDHADLQASLLKDLTYNSVDGRTGATAYTASGNYMPAADANQHGTVVGSILTMSANNGTGLVGIAHDAKLVSTLAVAAGANAPNLFTYLTDVARVDVSVHSYGLDPAFSENYYIAPGTAVADLNDKQLEGRAIARAATEGRNGKGIVIEVSSGNEAGNRADSGMTSFTSSRFIITSGAVNELGNKTTYTTPGTSVLVSSFGGENLGGLAQSVDQGFGLASADVSGALGYNPTAGAAGDYAYQNTGTSYSGPMVGATAALMLQANPDLGFRDVATILALTARGVGTQNNYVTNASTNWNLGGMHFSRDVGYGLIDVSAAVRLAESWTQTPGVAANWRSAEGAATAPSAAIPDNNPTGLSVSANVGQNVRIERVEFDLKLTSTTPSQLYAEVRSPSGTTMVLFDQPLAKATNAANNPGVADNPWPGIFTITSTAFLGESSQGTWTVKLVDKVTGQVSQYDSLTVRAWGSEITANSEYYFTNEFTGARVLTDASGSDTIQAAALGGNATISIANGGVSTFAGGTVTLAAGTTIENVISGAGNDTVTGNALGNTLRTNAGNDTLIGGGGSDILIGGQGADVFRFNAAADSNLLGFDVIADFLSGVDKIDLIALNAGRTQALTFGGNSATLLANTITFTADAAGLLVQGDIDGNIQTTDFQVLLSGVTTITAADVLFA